MKRSLLAIAATAGFVVTTVASIEALGQQPEVKLDNNWVRVFRVHLAPHERTPMHAVTTRLVVWLTDVHLRDSLASGKIQLEEHKAGDVTWVPSQRHIGVNLADAPIDFVAIEIKGAR